MSDHSSHPRISVMPRWQWVTVFCLVAIATLLAFAIFSFHSGGGHAFVSSEVRFTDASHGLSIVPASCPSDPFDSDSPYGCSGGTALCPDGSVAPNGDITQCTCAQGNINQCGSNIPTGTPGLNPDGTPTNGCSAGLFSENGVCVAQCDTGYTQQGALCVSNACPIGYALEGNSCVFVSCPYGYTDENGSCVLNQCAIGYSCVGSNLYYEDSSCKADLVQACAYGCSVDACLPSPTSTSSLTAAPTIVKKGETSLITWDAQNVVIGSCKVSGSNGDSWTGASGTQTSSKLESQVIYTLSCTGLDDSTVTEQVTVNVIPSFQEQ